jgi:hypothetical protein
MLYSLGTIKAVNRNDRFTSRPDLLTVLGLVRQLRRTEPDPLCPLYLRFASV